MRERDLFRAIVLSGAALTAGCTSASTSDGGVSSGGEDTLVADANTNGDAPSADASAPVDAPRDVPSNVDAGDDAMVLIL